MINNPEGKEKLTNFISLFPEFEDLNTRIKVDIFGYFLCVVEQQISFQATEILDCFYILNIPPYGRIRQYLSDEISKGAKSKYVKKDTGYAISRVLEKSIFSQIPNSPIKTQTTNTLDVLSSKVTGKEENIFLIETINCFKFGSLRSAIVMMWALTMYHLYQYTFIHKLSDFQNSLNKQSDKKLKTLNIRVIDDFLEMKESKFIEIAKTGGVITGGVKKILLAKLDIRNEAAHPSSIVITDIKAIDFIIDLTENVILKYTL